MIFFKKHQESNVNKERNKNIKKIRMIEVSHSNFYREDNDKTCEMKISRNSIS